MGSWWFEPVNQLRKLFLTGFVMMLPESMPKARPLAGMMVTLSFVCVMMYLDPTLTRTRTRTLTRTLTRTRTRTRTLTLPEP